MAIQGRNAGHWHLCEVAQNHILEQDFIFAGIRAQIIEFLDVAARAKGFRGSAMQDDTADIGSRRNSCNGFVQLPQHGSRDKIHGAVGQADFGNQPVDGKRYRACGAGNQRFGAGGRGILFHQAGPWFEWGSDCGRAMPCNTPILSN